MKDTERPHIGRIQNDFAEQATSFFELSAPELDIMNPEYESPFYETPFFNSKSQDHKNQKSEDSRRPLLLPQLVYTTPETKKDATDFFKLKPQNLDALKRQRSDSTNFALNDNFNYNDYVKSLNIFSFVTLTKSDGIFIINFQAPTLNGFRDTDLLPDSWVEILNNNNIIRESNPEPIIETVSRACEKKAKLISTAFHTSFCALDEHQCTFPQCAKIKSNITHIRNCKQKQCNIQDCVDIRKSIQHFGACSKRNCFFCNCIFIEIDNMIDTTTYDHDRADRKIKFPTIKTDIFTYLYESYHRFSALTMPNLDNYRAVDSFPADKTPPKFFDDHIYQQSIIITNTIPEEKHDDTILDNKEPSIQSNHDDSKEVYTSEYENPERIKSTYYDYLRRIMALPESVYFNQPVDPVKLEIPDYFEIIHEPMDFLTILQKLESLSYNSHWDFIYDMNLVFDNAFLYNKRVTRVHKCAVKLAQMFNDFSQRIMNSLGYCCNRRCVYSPQILYCNSNDFCVIPVAAFYYRHDEKTLFCMKCFDQFQGDVVDVIIDENETKKMSKSEFVKIRNNATIYEPLVSCHICHKRFHKVCSMHVDSINGIFYYCKPCIESNEIPNIPNLFVSSQLPVTTLSTFIEARVNNFLLSECKDCPYVTIRMICNIDKTISVKPGLLNRFPNAFPDKFPYKSKALFAFQKVDSSDEVCFFSMHVQEYGFDCPEPNHRRINLSYLDSVHYFKPKHLRTRLYHEILLSYLLYCKNMGFMYCHIWSCPPCEGFDYVFHCHSYEQKLPKPRRLLEWYIRMIELGVQNKIIIEYKDIYKYFEEYTSELAVAIPYFDGDYWSNSLEDLIDEHEKEINSCNDTPKNKKGDSLMKQVKKKSSQQKKTPSKKSAIVETTLNQKLMNVMDKYREVFFIIKLNESDVPFYRDSDPIFQSDLMDGRSGFLSLCRENNWEFSSFRHAVYSTKAMMYVVHQQMFNFLEFTCDTCKAVLVTGYHCNQCSSDFDLCKICWSRNIHKHELSLKTYVEFKLGSTVINLDLGGLRNGQIGDIIYSKEYYYKMFVKIAIHAQRCANIICSISSCRVLKSLTTHYLRCDSLDRTKCDICCGILKIYTFHAKHCSNSYCGLDACNKLKETNKPTRGVSNKKIQSRITKMTNQLKHDKESNQQEIILPSKSRKYHVPPDSDESISIKNSQPTSIINDPLFTIPPTTIPQNYSYGSLKSSSSNSGNPKPSNSNEKRTSRATSRKSKKSETPKNTPIPNDQIATMDNLRGLNPIPSIHFNKPVMMVNQNQNILQMGRNLSHNNMSRQSDMMFPNQGNTSLVQMNDGTLSRIQYSHPIQMQGNINIPQANTQYQFTPNRNQTPLNIRTTPSGDVRFSSPVLMQENTNISNSSMDSNRGNQNSNPSRIVRSGTSMGNESNRLGVNYNPNINTGFINNNDNLVPSRQNNPNYVIQTFPGNQDAQMIDPNSLQMLPNGTFVLNNSPAHLGQLNYMNLSHALQCQAAGYRNNIVINGAEKQIVNNSNMRNNYSVVNVPQGPQPQQNQNVMIRQTSQHGMNFNQMNPNYIQVPNMQNIQNTNNPRPNISNSFTLQGARTPRPQSLPNTTHGVAR